jgi:hypothetical protein
LSAEPGQRSGDSGAERDPESVSAGEGIGRIAERLRELEQRLRDPELPDDQAAEVAREAAELVSEAGNEIDRALREPDAHAE